MTLNLEEKTQILSNSTEEILEDFLRERTKGVHASSEDFSKDAKKENDSKILSQEKKIDVAELMKFDELIEAVDKFEALAKETKEVEEKLKEAKEDHDEHLNGYAGKITLADQNRDRRRVTLEIEEGKNLQEMIALKGDILDKLSDIKSHELRAKVYERFEHKKSDEVGMSSEVKLETKSDGHEDDLKQRALHHRVIDIAGPNINRINKRKAEAEKIVVETAPENVEPVVEQEPIIKEEEAKKAPEDHLAPGIKIGREEESETLKPEETQTEPPKDVIEQKDQPVAENKSEIEDKPSEPPVEFMEIGSDGELVSVTDNEGEFKEDTVIDGLAQPNIPQSKVGRGNDKIKTEVDEVKGKIKTIMGRIDEMRPKESVRKIDDFLPPTSRIKQAAETIEQSPDQTAASINTSEQMASQVQPATEPVASIGETVEPVVENNPLPEQPVQQNAVPEAKTAEPDDQILTQNIQAAETITPNIDVVQPEIQSPNIISEQEAAPVQPEVQPEPTVLEQKADNVVDIKPAIEARDAQIEQPAQEQKRGFFGKLFGGNNADRHGAEVIAGKGDDLTADHIHQILGAEEEKEAA